MRSTIELRTVWRHAMVAGALMAILAAAFTLWRLGTTPTPAEVVATQAMAAQGRGTRHVTASGAAARMVMVYVSGAVASPGLYRLPAGLRIGDALAAAGGMLPEADPDRLPNLAGRLTDGKQIKVPRLRSTSSRTTTKVDINSADVAQLEAVPGIDPALAQAIVDYRQSYGPFSNLAELKSALGLDSATLGVIRKYLIAG